MQGGAREGSARSLPVPPCRGLWSSPGRAEQAAEAVHAVGSHAVCKAGRPVAPAGAASPFCWLRAQPPVRPRSCCRSGLPLAPCSGGWATTGGMAAARRRGRTEPLQCWTKQNRTPRPPALVYDSWLAVHTQVEQAPSAAPLQDDCVGRAQHCGRAFLKVRRCRCCPAPPRPPPATPGVKQSCRAYRQIDPAFLRLDPPWMRRLLALIHCAPAAPALLPCSTLFVGISNCLSIQHLIAAQRTVFYRCVVWRRMCWGGSTLPPQGIGCSSTAALWSVCTGPASLAAISATCMPTLGAPPS